MKNGLVGRGGWAVYAVMVALGLGATACGDGGGSDVGADASVGADAGEELDTMSGSYTGARVGSIDWDSDRNSVSCVGDSSGFFALSGSNFGGGDERLSFAFHDYDGAGTYPYTFQTGDGPTMSIYLSGGYNYWFFYNRAGFGPEVPATCTLTVEQVGEVRIEGTLACGGLPANITSPDYTDVFEQAQPDLSLSVSFACNLSI